MSNNSDNSDDDFEPIQAINLEHTPTRVPCLTAPFVLRVGDQEGNLEDVVQATFSLCNQLGKHHMIHKRDKKRLILVCATQTNWTHGPCPFYVGARCDSVGYVRVHTLNTCHTCGVTSARKRNVKTSVLSSASPTIDAFVTSKARKGGNAAQLKEHPRFVEENGLKLS